MSNEIGQNHHFERPTKLSLFHLTVTHVEMFFSWPFVLLTLAILWPQNECMGIDDDELFHLSHSSILPFNFVREDFQTIIPVDSPILVAVTTCNGLKLVRRLLYNLALLEDDIDVVVIDDGSADNTTEFLERFDIPFVYLPWSLEEGGLARSWNEAWDIFKVSILIRALFDSNVIIQSDENWKTLVLLHNDVLLADGVLTRLSQQLHIAESKEYPSLAPISFQSLR
jgi:hypothetical protein